MLNITIELGCPVDEQPLKLFTNLLNELISIIGVDDLYLASIVIVPDDNVAQTVNALIKTTGEKAKYIQNSNHPADAVAVPLERDGGFTGVVVIGVSNLIMLAPDFHHPHSTVSALLEELLHIWDFSTAWKRRGFVQFRNEKLPACDLDLYALVSQMVGEYAVIRRKSEIIGQIPIMQAQPAGDLTTGRIQYGGSVRNELSAGISRVGEILRQRFDETTTSDLWHELMQTLYRGCFEPLARTAAYEDAFGQEELETALPSIPGFKGFFSDAWSKTHGILQTIYESRLIATEAGLDEMVEVIRVLLRTFGLTYHCLEGNNCWVSVVQPTEAGQKLD